MRITIEVEEDRAAGQTSAQTVGRTVGELKSTDVIDGGTSLEELRQASPESSSSLESGDAQSAGSPSRELIEALQSKSAGDRETAGGEMTKEADDGGAAPTA